jgi:hypothetical protein
MKRNRLLIVAAIAALSAVSGFAALSPAKADWVKGPVQFLMTKEEVAQWNTLQSDADADAFIALFWARRGGRRAMNSERISRRALPTRTRLSPDRACAARSRIGGKP